MGRTACTEPQCLYKGALYLLHFTRAMHGGKKKDADSHSEQVALIAFPRQKWLNKDASMLRLYAKASVGKVICRGGHKAARCISHCLSVNNNPCGSQEYEADRERGCKRIYKERRLTNI